MCAVKCTHAGYVASNIAISAKEMLTCRKPLPRVFTVCSSPLVFQVLPAFLQLGPFARRHVAAAVKFGLDFFLGSLVSDSRMPRQSSCFPRRCGGVRAVPATRRILLQRSFSFSPWSRQRKVTDCTHTP